MIFFKVPRVPEVFFPFRMVHYEWKRTNEMFLASQVWIDPHLLTTNLASNLMQI